MSSPIECLPVEIFELVATNLRLPSYRALRLSSRRLQLLVHAAFAKDAFSELYTTLGSWSIDRLIKISNHQHLRNAVKAIHVRLLTHLDYETLTSITRLGIFPPPKRFRRVSGVRDEHITDETGTYDYITGSEYPQQLYRGLVQALRGFPNLKVVRIRAKSYEPFQWRNNMPEGDQLFRARCFQTVLDAIIGSEVNLEEFAMTKAGPNAAPHKGVHLSCSGFKIPPQKLQALHHRFSHLQSLTLSVDTSYNTDKRLPGWEHAITDFITTAPKLRNLTLSLDRVLCLSHHGVAIVRSLASACRLRELEQFRLHNVALHGDDLIKLIRAHAASLKKVVFSDIRLLCGDWSSIWNVSRECERLKFLRLFALNGEKAPVRFSRRYTERPNITLDTKKSGQPMSDMLDDLIVSCDAQTEPTTHNINVHAGDVP
ncbi:hypothetical protein PTMSG1_02383 [Pyrenophora teres f. maculata]|nr:hypothetical protein PTMSG1_02383 [Pyrenophora teres f. maculata]